MQYCPLSVMARCNGRIRDFIRRPQLPNKRKSSPERGVIRDVSVNVSVVLPNVYDILYFTYVRSRKNDDATCSRYNVIRLIHKYSFNSRCIFLFVEYIKPCMREN